MNSSRQPSVKPETRQPRKSAIGGLIGLILIAGSATAIVSVVEQLTRERIAANQSARAMQIIAEVLPRGSYNNNPQQDSLSLTDSALLGGAASLPAYRARFDQSPVAVALTVDAPDGYVAPIRLLVGIDNEGYVTAVRALRHVETPGLGDQIDIDKSDWVIQFNGRKLSAGRGSLALKRDGGDLDHISGATITSRAVSKAVSNALKYYEQNREQLFAPDAASQMPAQEP